MHLAIKALTVFKLCNPLKHIRKYKTAIYREGISLRINYLIWSLFSNAYFSKCSVFFSLLMKKIFHELFINLHSVNSPSNEKC